MACAIEEISGLDDLAYDVTLTDSAGAAITTGVVTMSLCTAGTASPLGGLAAASQALSHVSGGRWTGTHDDTNVALAIAPLAIGQRFDRVLTVTGLAVRTQAQCVRVAVVARMCP
jgi:hypothetical protein